MNSLDEQSAERNGSGVRMCMLDRAMNLRCENMKSVLPEGVQTLSGPLFRLHELQNCHFCDDIRTHSFCIYV